MLSPGNRHPRWEARRGVMRSSSRQRRCFGDGRRCQAALWWPHRPVQDPQGAEDDWRVPQDSLRQNTKVSPKRNGWEWKIVVVLIKCLFIFVLIPLRYSLPKTVLFFAIDSRNIVSTLSETSLKNTWHCLEIRYRYRILMFTVSQLTNN